MLDALEQTTARKATTLERVLSIEPTPRVERLREGFLGLQVVATMERARVETRIMRE